MGDALLRFARSCKQTVSRNPFRHPRKRESWIQKGSSFVSALPRNCKAEHNSNPHPFYNKVKNNLKQLFFTQGSQTRNAKFN